MKTRIELEAAIKEQKAILAAAEKELADFESLAENNIFDDMDTATSAMEDYLQGLAYEDCQGAYNCGQEEYEQDFIVAGVTYTAKMTFEYNRHDKTYYYIEESEFSYSPKVS